jgi:hypothetical protein
MPRLSFKGGTVRIIGDSVWIRLKILREASLSDTTLSKELVHLRTNDSTTLIILFAACPSPKGFVVNIFFRNL